MMKKELYAAPATEVLELTLENSVLNNVSATYNAPFDPEQDWSSES